MDSNPPLRALQDIREEIEKAFSKAVQGIEDILSRLL